MSSQAPSYYATSRVDYLAYGFTTITDATSLHRMFLALETAREALEG